MIKISKIYDNKYNFLLYFKGQGHHKHFSFFSTHLKSKGFHYAYKVSGDRRATRLSVICQSILNEIKKIGEQIFFIPITMLFLNETPLL